MGPYAPSAHSRLPRGHPEELRLHVWHVLPRAGGKMEKVDKSGGNLSPYLPPNTG
ncbi:hypothetical protein DPMN_093517 [Dreissena polymorpha]|uniref:Uncharacterized protein n=1 Tax=Dreissena polymorpha TaxID=45954 RepID=A0A9D4R2M3_DREPO|nr:hypothetical protein DPMN_093517 [Dreissena polymorpha]